MPDHRDLRWTRPRHEPSLAPQYPATATPSTFERYRSFLSHEMRSRLHLIRLALYQWDLLPGELEPEDERLMSTLHTATEQLARLAEDLRPRGSSVPDARSSRPIREVVEELVQEAHPLATQQDAHLEALEPLPEAPVDGGRLELVLFNLIDNALRHLDPDKPERWTQVAVEPFAEGWRFSVIDNGVGIPEPLRSRVFDERVRGEGDVRGDGLGLALARCVVEEQGGRIWIESREGRGTAVRFDWPSDGNGSETMR